MIQSLSDADIIAAATFGVRCFRKRYRLGASLGSEEDILHEGYAIAYRFVRQCDDREKLTPYIVTQRVIFGLIDLLRQRLKSRWITPRPRFVAPFEGYDGIDDPALESIDLADAFNVLETRLTEKETIVFVLLRRGLSQAQIARRLGLSKSSVAKRLEKIRRKLSAIL